MKFKMKEIAAIMILLLVGFQAYSQEINISKVRNQAEKLFQVSNYAEALPLFLSLEKAGGEVENLPYKIAKCFSASSETNDVVRSLKYFESVDVSTLDQLPHNFYLDFADAYMIDDQIEQALIYYNRQLGLVATDKRAKSEVEKRIAQAKHAYDIMRIPKNVEIHRLGSSINSEFTEYNPVVSADESVMAFTVLRPSNSKTGEKMAEEIQISYNETGSWSMPRKVAVQTQNNYGTAGISADGHEMLVFIGDLSGGSIFSIEKDGADWSRPVPLGTGVQSKYMETTASISPDNKTIYFASNRPGGYGGFDIYVSKRNENGTWGSAENLGPQINTTANEDAPFIHPNNKLLFFTTDGHNGMGGNDIYKSEMTESGWSKPKNMGYPINTIANDNYFTLIADGTRGYFSSDRKGGLGGQDIFVMDMPEDYETIPLTLIKGRILDAETKLPLKTKIYMVDTQTKEKIDYVYHPNEKTGNYLVILPPNKSYDMIIESDGFLPYTLNIDVPNQTEFYELYQKIYLKTIKHFDVIVGQEVQVKNAFYYTQDESRVSIRREHEAALIEYDSIDAYELMGDLISAVDRGAIDYLIELLMIENPIDEIDFDESNEKVRSARRIYYYDESDESKFEKKEVGGETIYSLPTMFVTIEAQQQRQQTAKLSSADYDVHMLTNVLKVYFEAGESALKKKYESDLDKILKVLEEYPEFGVEISGYASAEGDMDFNKKLSNQRAISVLNYINHKGIVRRRIIAKGFGASSDSGMSKEESRRVDVKVVDLKKL
jgi:outer membrane protein OmpA-like peptidoglycan-associated protein